MSVAGGGSSATPSNDRVGDPDQAWKTLALVNDWIRHAETKATLTITAAGVMAGVLYNVIKQATPICSCMVTLSSLTGVLIVASATLAGMALWPRLGPSEKPESLLYFDHIARKYPASDDRRNYVREFGVTTSSCQKLFDEIGDQIWANSRVAQKKYKWASWGLAASFAALGFLAITAFSGLIGLFASKCGVRSVARRR